MIFLIFSSSNFTYFLTLNYLIHRIFFSCSNITYWKADFVASHYRCHLYIDLFLNIYFVLFFILFLCLFFFSFLCFLGWIALCPKQDLPGPGVKPTPTPPPIPTPSTPPPLQRKHRILTTGQPGKCSLVFISL